MSDVPRVEVVLLNYRRPDNIGEIVVAFRQQTAPCSITLIDLPAGPEFVIGEDVRNALDYVFSSSVDFGPFSRYMPMAAFAHKCTYFHDDDMLPGRRVIEHFLHGADNGPEFGVLGQLGRRLASDGNYCGNAVKRGSEFVQVDFVVRGFFVRTGHLPAVIQFRHAMQMVPDANLEDDLLLCTTMNVVLGLDDYLTPQDPDIKTRMIKTGLPSRFARQHRGNHIEARTEFCRKAMAAGWVPLGQRESGIVQDR